MDVVLEAKGGTHKDEGLQVEVPRGERLESREDLLGNRKSRAGYRSRQNRYFRSN